jgi:hypothetical protein
MHLAIKEGEPLDLQTRKTLSVCPKTLMGSAPDSVLGSVLARRLERVGFMIGFR